MNIRQSLFYSLLQRYFSFIIQFATNIIISRLLLPEEIGVFSLSVAALGIVQVMREFGIGRYIVQEKHLTEDSIRTAFGLMILFSWAFALGVFGCRDLIADFYDRTELKDIITVLLINFLVLPFGQPARALLNREMEFRKTFFIDMSSVVVHAVVGVSCAFLGFSSMSLAYAAVAGTTVTSVLTLIAEPTHIKLRPNLKAWRKILSYGAFATSSSVIGTTGGSAAEIVMGKVLTFAAVGLYSRASGLISVFQVQLMYALGRVAFSGFAKLLRAGEKIEGRYLKSLSFLTGFLWPIYTVLAFSSGALIVFLFGETWADAVPAARVLCVNGMVMACFALMQSVYNALGAVKRQFVNEIVVQSVRISMIVAVAPYGIEAVAWAQVAASVLNGIALYRMVGPAFVITFGDLVRALRKSAILTLITATAMAVAFLVLSLVPHGNLATLITAAIVGTASWLIGVRLTRHEISPEIVLWLAAAVRRIKGLRK